MFGDFQPDYRHFAAVMRNERPARLPIYEHIITPEVMEEILGERFAEALDGQAEDLGDYFEPYCRFFREMTYDTVSFEVCITPMLPDHGAINGGRPGPIQSRDDFERFPWQEIPRIYWDYASPRFDALVAALPEGMKAVGGVGNGLFEISEDLVGLEWLPFMQVDDPPLYADLFARIGDLMLDIWRTFLSRYADAFVACRFGDDLGHKSSLLTNPSTVRDHIVPQYRRVIETAREAGRPFLWHSCGCIFEVMEDVIALGIGAKHSNEDAIAPFSKWISAYGDRIALLGGFDMDFLCRCSPEEVREQVYEQGRSFRNQAKGYALGSGNSIPDYVPVDNYMAMIEGARDIRRSAEA